MKKVITIFALLAIVYFSSEDVAYTYSTGAPAGNTASPGDGGATCNTAYCHSGPSAQSGENIAISVLQPLDHGPYRISIEVSNSGGMQYEKVGFQACVEDDFGNKIGEISLVDPTRTKFPNGNSDYITHTWAGTYTSDDFSHLWEFDWTPPANFEGQVAKVYAASILSNNNNQNNGDICVSSNVTINTTISGCTNPLATNFYSDANIDDGSCIGLIGCTNPLSDNYNDLAVVDDSSCYRFGCTSNLAVNYDEYATIDDENCDFDIITHLNMSFDAWNISIDLSVGWNMFGYGCPTSIDVAQGLSNHTESIIITKDNNGNVYMPEFGFNGIGDFKPGFGYQIKLTEAIEGFSLCDWYVNDIPEDNIVSLQEENVQLNNTNLDYQEIIFQQQDSLTYINSLIGCKDNNACNYSEIAIYHNGLCEYAQLGYDCQGNQILTYQIGDYTQGGVVFYVDETGYHGLVVALEDIEGSFVWGCSGTNINVPYINLGDGLNNSIQILNNCFESPTAASAAESYQVQNYDDWYLPSKNEFYEILFNVENLSDLNLSNDFYWSSSEINEYYAWQVEIGSITTLYRLKTNSFKVRPIRSF